MINLNQCKIILQDSTDEVLIFAKDLLMEYLEKITGKRHNDHAAEGIYIGYNEAGEEDAIEIFIKNGCLCLTGGKKRGAIYAVIAFLEDYCGVRWWTWEEEYVPKKESVEIEEYYYSYNPPIRMRDATSYYTTYVNFHVNSMQEDAQRKLKIDRFCIFNRLNGFFTSIPENMGGHYKLWGLAHTFEKILDPKKYFSVHPEWFGEMSGIRQPYQLCLTNKAMRAEFSKNLLKIIQNNPNYTIFSVSQNDWPEPCQCEQCQEYIRQHGNNADLLVDFINYNARKVKERYPHVMLETFAYQWSRPAPIHAVADDNVIVRICSIECSQNHAIESEENRHFCVDADAWSRKSHQMILWNYTLNAHQLLNIHPYNYNTPKDLAYYISRGYWGIFQQGEHYNATGNFLELKLWLYARLLYHPELSQDALIEEYINGYYRSGAQYIKQYWNIVHCAYQNSGQYWSCFFRDYESCVNTVQHIMSQISVFSWLSLDKIIELSQLYDLAKIKVQTEDLKKIENAFIAVISIFVSDYESLDFVARRNHLCLPHDKDWYLNEFKRVAIARRADYYVEGSRASEDMYLKLIEDNPVISDSTSIIIKGYAFNKGLSERNYWIHRFEEDRLCQDPAAKYTYVSRLCPQKETIPEYFGLNLNVGSFYFASQKLTGDLYLSLRFEGEGELSFEVIIYDMVHHKDILSKSFLTNASRVYNSFCIGEEMITDGYYIKIVPNRKNVSAMYLEEFKIMNIRG